MVGGPPRPSWDLVWPDLPLQTLPLQALSTPWPSLHWKDGQGVGRAWRGEGLGGPPTTNSSLWLEALPGPPWPSLALPRWRAKEGLGGPPTTNSSSWWEALPGPPEICLTWPPPPDTPSPGPLNSLALPSLEGRPRSWEGLEGEGRRGEGLRGPLTIN